MIRTVALFLLLAPIALAQTPPNFKVAFIGDQGIGNNAEAVLHLIVDEGADMVLAQGDLGYQARHSDTPQRFEDMLTNILGADFPFVTSIGNHDKAQWNDYRQLLSARASRAGVVCTGDYGTKAACTYQGLFFVLSALGQRDDGDYSSNDTEQDQIDFIRTSLQADNSLWSICSWHLNRREMQVGGQSNHIGFGGYDACREQGAIIMTAHEHSYSRTHVMADFANQVIVSNSNDLIINAGQSFVVVSGLGGNSVRPQERNDPWWGSVYTSTQGATYGALFCTFNVDGLPGKAACYFKNINNQVIDTFTLFADAGSETPPQQCRTVTICE